MLTFVGKRVGVSEGSRICILEPARAVNWVLSRAMVCADARCKEWITWIHELVPEGGSLVLSVGRLVSDFRWRVVYVVK